MPVSDVQASEASMKLMLLSLQSELQSDFKSSILALQTQIAELGKRTDKLESKTSEHVHNTLIDAYLSQQHLLQQLQMKIADLVDRS